jgi:hypothetical protein
VAPTLEPPSMSRSGFRRAVLPGRMGANSEGQEVAPAVPVVVVVDAMRRPPVTPQQTASEISTAGRSSTPYRPPRPSAEPSLMLAKKRNDRRR